MVLINVYNNFPKMVLNKKAKGGEVPPFAFTYFLFAFSSSFTLLFASSKARFSSSI